MGDGLRLEDLPDVLTVMEAARLLRVGRNTAYDLARMGTLPAIRIGRRMLIPKGGLLQMLSAATGGSK